MSKESADRPTDDIRVHLLHPPPERALRHLQTLIAPSIQLSIGSDNIPGNLDLLVAGRPSHELLKSQAALRALVIPYAGVPAETRSLLLDHFPDLSVFNLHHNAVAASELALALFLSAAKTLLSVDKRFRANDWTSRYDGAPTMLLEGKTAVILGYGAIGQRLAAACRALGMNVHAIRRSPDTSACNSVAIHPMAELDHLLPKANALFIALPLTPETEGLLGASRIALLPSDCVLVNIARGKIVGEEALYTALRERKIAGAGIDVWYQYPTSADTRASTPPSQFPFHELDNLVMSPHRGGAFRLDELEQRRMTDLAETLNAFACNETVPHEVDVLAGY